MDVQLQTMYKTAILLLFFGACDVMRWRRAKLINDNWLNIYLKISWLYWWWQCWYCCVDQLLYINFVVDVDVDVTMLMMINDEDSERGWLFLLVKFQYHNLDYLNLFYRQQYKFEFVFHSIYLFCFFFFFLIFSLLFININTCI